MNCKQRGEEIRGYEEEKHEGQQRHSYDLQMRLTRRVPSVSLQLSQTEMSGWAPEANEWKSCVSEGKKEAKKVLACRVESGGRERERCL